MLPIVIDCETCPVQGERCGECMVTAVAALGPVPSPAGWPGGGWPDGGRPEGGWPGMPAGEPPWPDELERFLEPGSARDAALALDVELALDADDHLVVDRFVRSGLLSPAGAWEVTVVAEADERRRVG